MYNHKVTSTNDGNLRYTDTLAKIAQYNCSKLRKPKRKRGMPNMA